MSIYNIVISSFESRSASSFIMYTINVSSHVDSFSRIKSVHRCKYVKDLDVSRTRSLFIAFQLPLQKLKIILAYILIRRTSSSKRDDLQSLAYTLISGKDKHYQVDKLKMDAFTNSL